MEDWEFDRIFRQRIPDSEEGLVEDLSIVRLDGVRSCANWELTGDKYHLENLSRDPYSVM